MSMKYQIKDYPEIKIKISHMTAEELLCMVLCPNFSDDSPIWRNTGAVFFHGAPNEVLAEQINAVNHDREFPALIVKDVESDPSLENGTHFPSMQACALADSEELAYETGRICAVENTQFGYQWGFGPCVDILGNVNNPITGNRSAGTDPEKIIKISAAIIAGMQDHGLIATAKHFPGDGYCIYDQHLTTPVNPLPFKDWMSSYGKIYKALINKGVKTIMPGHISLPSYDDIDEETGICRPATLSKKLLTELLKNTLGFKGIIVSDATNMGGFCGYMNYYYACAEFLNSGGDMLLFAHPDRLFIDEMMKLVNNGKLPISILKDRAYRVMCFAKEHQNFSNTVKFDKTKHQQIADEITRKGIVVERDRYRLIPFKLSNGSRILYNVISSSGVTPFDNQLITSIKKITDNVEIISDIGPDATVNLIRKNNYDLVICSVTPRFEYGTNVSILSGPLARNMMGGWQKLGTPVIFITSSCSLATEYKAAIDTIINTHGVADKTATYTIQKIFTTT